MRKLAWLCLLLVPALALADDPDLSKDPKFQGAGWYIVVSSLMSESIDQGPFPTEDACKAAMPSEEEQEDMAETIGMTEECRQL